MKNYPNIRVSPETYKILGHLKKVRRSSYDTVIQDMLVEFAPFLVSSVRDYDDPRAEWIGDKEEIYRCNCREGAKAAYANYVARLSRKLEDEYGEVTPDKETMKWLSETRDKIL